MGANGAKFLMRATPASVNYAHPTGYFEIVDLVKMEVVHGRPAPKTESEARQVVTEWAGRNDRWVFEYLGAEHKRQTWLNLEG